MRDYRVVVLGAGGVGKTSLINRFLTGTFQEDYTPTVDDIYRPIVRLQDGSIHGIEVLDTAGHHQFPAMRHLAVQSGRAFVVVFSLGDAHSMKDAASLIDSIRQSKGATVPIVLVGNKSDLDPDPVVRPAPMEQLAGAQSCSYVETSVKWDVNVHHVFLLVLNALFHVVPQDMPARQGSLKGRGGLGHRLTSAMRRSLSSSSSESDTSTGSERLRDQDRCVLM